MKKRAPLLPGLLLHAIGNAAKCLPVDEPRRGLQRLGERTDHPPRGVLTDFGADARIFKRSCRREFKQLTQSLWHLFKAIDRGIEHRHKTDEICKPLRLEA